MGSKISSIYGEGNSGNSGSKSLKPWLMVLLILAGLLFLRASYYTINSGTAGVLATFGKFSEAVKMPGLHFKIPLIQSVYILDIKMITANYQTSTHIETGDGLLNRPIIEILDNKNLPIGIEMSVQFIPQVQHANHILAQYGDNYFDKLINPLVRNVVRDVIGNYHAEEIATQRSQIGTAIKTRLQEGFVQFPFDLKDIALRDIKLPEIVLAKIKEVQLAKQEEQRLAMVEKQAQKEQQIKTIQAETRLIEITTQAKANAEKQRIEADAKAYQIQKEAEAIAAANTLIGKSASPELIRYRSVERWDGSYPRMLLNSGSEQSMILALPPLEAPTQMATPPKPN